MELKDIVAIASSGVAASVAIFNWRATRFRGKLKDDLEIIKRYREELVATGLTQDQVASDEDYIRLRNRLKRKIKRAYGIHGTDWSDALIGLALAALAVFLFGYSGFKQFAWVKAIGGVACVVAVFFFYEAVKRKGKERDV